MGIVRALEVLIFFTLMSSIELGLLTYLLTHLE